MMEPSKSTDKLALLCEAFKFIPEAALVRLKTFELKWKSVDSDDDILAPEVTATFIEERVKPPLEELLEERQLAAAIEERLADEFLTAADCVISAEARDCWKMIIRALRRA